MKRKRKITTINELSKKRLFKWKKPSKEAVKDLKQFLKELPKLKFLKRRLKKKYDYDRAVELGETEEALITKVKVHIKKYTNSAIREYMLKKMPLDSFTFDFFYGGDGFYSGGHYRPYRSFRSKYKVSIPTSEYQKYVNKPKVLETFFQNASPKVLKLIKKSPYIRNLLSKVIVKRLKKDLDFQQLILDLHNKKLTEKRFAEVLGVFSGLDPAKALSYIHEAEEKSLLKRFGGTLPSSPISRVLKTKSFDDIISAREVWKASKKFIPKEKPINILEIGPGKSGLETIKTWKESERKGKLTLIEKRSPYLYKAYDPAIPPEKLKKAIKKHNLKNVKAIEGDALKHRYKKNSYDHIYMRLVLNTLKDNEERKKLYQKLKPSLKKGGLLHVVFDPYSSLIEEVFNKKDYVIKFKTKDDKIKEALIMKKQKKDEKK